MLLHLLRATTCSLVLSLALLTTIASSQTESGEPPLIAYVGTFSSPLGDVLPTQVDLPPGNGQGIHLFRVNRSDGSLAPLGVFPLGTSPSSLIIDAQGEHLYSANETDRVEVASAESSAQTEPPQGTVSAFAIDRTSGTLKLLNSVPSGGAGPTYVSLHPSGQHLLVANYFGGSVAVLPVLPNGNLGMASDVKNDQGRIGPTRSDNAPRGSFAFSGHDRTHAHMIQSDPTGNYVFHVDLGLDLIYSWKFDDQSGKLQPNDPAAYSLPPGDGPRHFFFHPNRKWMYSIQEEGSTVVLFDYDSSRGRLSPRQTISTLPASYQGSNFCSEILVSHDGRFLYVGNRLHDSIGIFSIGSDGMLTHLADEWTRGNYPRSFNFDPTGRFLYCCNQRADNVAIFEVEPTTGMLNFTQNYAAVGNPSCIVFLDLAQ